MSFFFFLYFLFFQNLAPVLAEVYGLTNRSLEEDEVLNGDIYGMIAPYITANFWVCH